MVYKMRRQARANFRSQVGGRIRLRADSRLLRAALTPGRRRQFRMWRVRSALALGRIPVFRWKCDTPEQWRRFGKFDSNFHLARILLPNKRDGAGKLFGCLGIHDRHLLGARHAIRHFDHAAVGVYRYGMGLFFEILRAGRSSYDHGHCDLDALRAPALRTGFAHARYRALDLSHQSSPDLLRKTPQNAPFERRTCVVTPKFYTARFRLLSAISRPRVPIVNTPLRLLFAKSRNPL